MSLQQINKQLKCLAFRKYSILSNTDLTKHGRPIPDPHPNLQCPFRGSNSSSWRAPNLQIPRTATLTTASELADAYHLYPTEYKNVIEKYFHPCDKPWQSIILDREASKQLVKALKQDLKKDDLIAEINPGVGVLTDRLIEDTNNNLLLFEPRQIFREHLKTQYSQYIDKNRLRVSHYNLLKNYNYYINWLRDGQTEYEDFMKLFPKKKDPSCSNVKIVGTVSDQPFFSRLLLSNILEVSLHGKLNSTLYIFMSAKDYERYYGEVTIVKNSIKCSLHSKLFFNVKLIKKFPVPIIFPVSTKNRKKKYFNNGWCLVKIEPNFALANVLDSEQKILLLHFLKVIVRKSLVENLLTALSFYIPHIGEDFVKAGFKPSMVIQDLSVNQIFVLFIIFLNHPDFRHSNFTRDAHITAKKLTGMNKL